MENITHSRATGLVPPPAVGVCVGSAKLTEENVIDICKLVRDGVLSERKIGAMFGVGQATIHKIKHGERWSHLEAVRDNVNFLSERWVRLTEAQQKEIAALYESGTVSQRHLAAKYGVSQPTIQKAIRVWASKIAR
jgi:transposase